MSTGFGFFSAALLIRALGWLVITTLIFWPLEALFPIRRDAPGKRDLRANLGWFFINSMITLPLVAAIGGALAWLAALVQPTAWVAMMAALPLPLRVMLIMLAGELGFYWGHRWSHEWPWLWRFHCIHHSPTHLHYLVNTRMHPVDMVFTRMCGVVLLIACGLATGPGVGGGLTLPLVLVIGSGWSYFVHADVAVRLGPFERLIASPAFHHWHHADLGNGGQNYAAMLPLFDILFGTYRRAQAWPKTYGCDIAPPPDLIGQLSFPFERP